MLRPRVNCPQLRRQLAAGFEDPAMTETESARRVREILATEKLLAVEYYQLTGKPLGVTREIAEYVAAETLGRATAQPARPRVRRRWLC
jgi:hypothetical protein